MCQCALITQTVDVAVSEYLNGVWKQASSLTPPVTLWIQPKPQKERIEVKTFGTLADLNGEEISRFNIEEATLWGKGWQLTLYQDNPESTRLALWMCEQSVSAAEKDRVESLPGGGEPRTFELKTQQKKVSFDGGESFEPVTAYLQDGKLKWFHFGFANTHQPVKQGA